MSSADKHFVAVIGGAVSGSVASEILADNGIEVVVIEQNDRPYGKIEDGLPRWHNVQRRKEYERIDGRLMKEGVHFVPRTKLGRELDFNELANEWGLSAILLANGAWRDRNLGIEGADDYVGKGIEYQNPFIYWFNHKTEKAFSGRQIEVPGGAIIFGGGLASIDVLKVCQLETYERALKARGIEVTMLELEKKGIPATCAKHGIEDPKELGVKNCLLLYRRRKVDMPLAPNEKARGILLQRAMDKYLFEIQDKTLPTGLIIEDGRVTGVRVVRTEVDGRKATPIEGTEHELRTDMIISSIGSVPEPIEGIDMKGEWYTWKDWDMGIYDGVEGVFGVGNVVTGQGNIRKSLVHAQTVTKYLNENYFRGALGAASAEVVKEHVDGKDPLPEERIEEIRVRIAALQTRVGYGGDYNAWIDSVTPDDLE